MDAQLDFSPLQAPIDSAALRVFTSSSKAAGVRPTSTNWLKQTVVAIILALVVAGVIVMFVRSLLTTTYSTGNLVISIIVMVVATVFDLFVWLYVVVTINMYRSRWKLLYRLTEFAQRNGLTYTSRAEGAPFTGALFGLGVTQYRANVFAQASPIRFELGTFRYSVPVPGSSRMRESSQAYLALTLRPGTFGEPWPLTILRAKKPTGALAGYQPDVPQIATSNAALGEQWDIFSDAPASAIDQLMTPKLIDLLTGRSGPAVKGENALEALAAAGDYDLELLGDQVWVYGPRTYQWVGHATMRRMLGIARIFSGY